MRSAYFGHLSGLNITIEDITRENNERRSKSYPLIHLTKREHSYQQFFLKRSMA